MGSSIEYTRAVTAVAEGGEYGSLNIPDGTRAPAEGADGNLGGQPETESKPEDGEEAIPDELPEESDLEDDNFIDN